MGFFSIFKKPFKAIGKVFKKVGKFIKSNWKKLGKFMNKLGIAGQIGMMLITGAAGSALMSGIGSMAGNLGFKAGLNSMIQAGGIKGTLAKIVKTGVNKVIQTGQVASKAFKGTIGTVTDMVGGVVKPVIQSMGEMIGVPVKSPILGQGGAGFTDTVLGNWSDALKKGKLNLVGAKDAATSLVTDFDPLKNYSLGGVGPDASSYEDATGIAGKAFEKVDPNSTFQTDKSLLSPQSVEGKTATDNMFGDPNKALTTKITPKLESFKFDAGPTTVNPLTLSENIPKKAREGLLSNFDVGGAFSSATSQALLSSAQSREIYTPTSNTMTLPNPEVGFKSLMQVGVGQPTLDFSGGYGAFENTLFNNDTFNKAAENLYNTKMGVSYNF